MRIGIIHPSSDTDHAPFLKHPLAKELIDYGIAVVIPIGLFQTAVEKSSELVLVHEGVENLRGGLFPAFIIVQIPVDETVYKNGIGLHVAGPVFFQITAQEQISVVFLLPSETIQLVFSNLHRENRPVSRQDHAVSVADLSPLRRNGDVFYPPLVGELTVLVALNQGNMKELQQKEDKENGHDRCEDLKAIPILRFFPKIMHRYPFRGLCNP